MKKYTVEISKDTIRIVSDDNNVVNRIFLMHWLTAFILQAMIDKNEQLEEILQEYLDDYCFQISNSSSLSEIRVPDEMTLIISEIQNQLAKKTNINLRLSNIFAEIDEAQLKKIFEDVYERLLFDKIGNLENSEILLEIEETFGSLFADCLKTIFEDFGNAVVFCTNHSALKNSIKVRYDGKEILPSGNGSGKFNVIEIGENITENIKIEVFFGNEKRNYEIVFPFLKAKDTVKLYLSEEEGSSYLRGIHVQSGITSIVKVE